MHTDCEILLVPSKDEIQYSSSFDVIFGCAKMYDIESLPDNILESRTITLTWSKPDCKACEAKHKGCKRKIYGAESDETECFDIPGKGKKSLFYY